MMHRVLSLAAMCVTGVSALGMPQFHKAGRLTSESTPPENFWPNARGTPPEQYGTTDIVAPHDLNSTLAWSWQHPDGQYHTVVAGGPVIDSRKNLYLTTFDGFRKFSPDGRTLWHYKPPAQSNNMPALMGNYVYVNDKDGHAFALDQETGEPVWESRPSNSAGGDSGYPGAYDGLFVMGTMEGRVQGAPGGNWKVVALDAYNGSVLWDFELNQIVWNFMPLFPGDDTCVFMDMTGGVYRLGLHNGTLLWYTPGPNSEGSFTDGGAILGPNKLVYTCSNPETYRGAEGSLGALRAFQVSDGTMLWEQLLPQPCNSYPSVGYLGGSQSLSVVVTPGAFMGSYTMHGSVMAFDASSGQPQWQYQAPVYHRAPGVRPGFEAYGDNQGFTTRLHNRVQAMCMPAHWSCPTISGDGSVFAARSDGNFYVIRGPDVASTGDSLANLAHVDSTVSLGIDFASSEGVTADIFFAQGASLHGAAGFAPGMMAVATCDTLYVFKF